jgi:hypothetical protein
VLLQGGEIAFVDFDRSCRAEPALDVALFRAVVKDIGLRALQAGARTTPDAPPRLEHLSRLDALCQAFSTCYAAEAPVSPRRVALWEALELFTLVLHSWTKVQSDRLRPRLALLRHHLRTSGLAE